MDEKVIELKVIELLYKWCYLEMEKAWTEHQLTELGYPVDDPLLAGELRRIRQDVTLELDMRHKRSDLS